MENLLTPTMIWEDFEGVSEDFCEDVLSERSQNGVRFTQFFFNGQKKEDGVVRLFTTVARPEGEEAALPCVLIVNPVDRSVDDRLLAFFAKQGFIAMSCDLAGLSDRKRFTFWPESLEFANTALAKERLFRAEPNAKETPWYEWTVAMRHAVSFAKKNLSEKIGVIGIGNGANIVWQLGYCEPDLTCAVTVFGAGWEEYRGHFKYSENNQIEIDVERGRWLAGVAPQAYAHKLNCPMLYVGATNDRLGDVDRAFDTMARVPGSVLSLVSIAPRTNGLLGKNNVRTMVGFLKKLLTDVFIEDVPALAEFVASNGELRISAQFEKPETVKCATLFYAQENLNPHERNWQEVKMEDGGSGIFFATLKLTSTGHIFAFVSTEYEDGLVLSSNYLVATPEALGLSVPTVRKQKILYNGMMGKDTFFPSAKFEAESFVDCFLEGDPVLVQKGPNGIDGITSMFPLSTHKIANSTFRGEAEQLLLFDLYSLTAQTVRVELRSNCGLEDEQIFVATREAVGGEIWEKMEFSAKDFKTADGLSLQDFSRCTFLSISGETKVVINNMLWL